MLWFDVILQVLTMKIVLQAYKIIKTERDINYIVKYSNKNLLDENISLWVNIFNLYPWIYNIFDIIFRRIHFEECQRFTKLHRLPFIKYFCRTFVVLSMQFIRVDDLDRSIGQDSPYILTIFLVIPIPRLPIYLECVVNIWKVHRLLFGLGIHLCQLVSKFYDYVYSL